MKDANEMLRAGVDLRKYADGAEKYEPKRDNNVRPIFPQKGGGHHADTGAAFTLVHLEEVEPEQVDWIWDSRLAVGKITLLGGDPDLGKSQIAIDMAARISRGTHWPQGARAPIGSTIFLCSEDGVADTIRPRAEAATADLSRLRALESSYIVNGKRKQINLQDDLHILAKAIKRVGDVKLIVVDALTSYVGKVDNNSQSDIRQVLDPVSRFAEDNGVAFVGIMHPPKGAQSNAIRNFAGSFAYVQSARLAFFAMKEVDGDRTILHSVKNNLGLKAPDKGFRIRCKEISNYITAPYVEWDDAPVDMTMDQAMAATASARRGGSSLSDAMDFLREILATGTVDAKEGTDFAKAHGISDRTLDRARKMLGVKVEKDGFQGKWIWRLP